MKLMHYQEFLRKTYTFLSGVTMLLFLFCCNNIVDEPPPTAVIELHSGGSHQLTASSSNVQWGSDNPTVATVSATGLVTAVGVGKAAIFTYSSGSEQHIVCYVEVYPKRNILFYIATDNNQLDNGSEGDEPRTAINAIRAGWTPGRGEMLIYTDQTRRRPCLMRIAETQNADGLYDIDTIMVYEEENSASALVLSRVINTVVRDYPEESYGMIFFSHASGWLPEGMLSNPRSSLVDDSNANHAPIMADISSDKPRSLVIDRGDGTSREMKYEDFAAAIPDKQFDFIIFEACFMADVMTMYELRNKSEYVLASSAEIVSPGYTPLYRDHIMQLYDTKNPVPTVVSEFAKIFINYITSSYSETHVRCSSTLGLIKTSEMGNLATTVRATLNGIKLDETTLSVDNIQRFDRPNKLIGSGQRKNRYFDFGHAMENLVPASQLAAFRTQMGKTVVWKANTKRFLLSNNGNTPYYAEYDGFFIEHHSGLSTYIEQSAYPILNSAYKNSSWYKAIYTN